MTGTAAGSRRDNRVSARTSHSYPIYLLLAIVGLWSAAVLDPVLELASESAFVVAHGLSGAESAMFGIALVIGIPLLIAAGSWAIDRFVGTPIVSELAVSALTALAVMGMLRHLGWLSFALGVLTGVVVYVRRWHKPLAVTIVFAIVAIAFWFGPSGVGNYARAAGNQSAVAVSVPEPVPVVMIAFDELPAHALLDSELNVNAERYPAFADLARQSTFFRLTSSVSPQTSDSLPALASGIESDPERSPVSADYPTSVMSLFSDSHEIIASEAFTQLCNDGRCFGRGDLGLNLLVEDTAVYLADTLLPFYENENVGQSWSHFRSPDFVEAGWTAESEVDRFRSLFTTQPAGDRPPLYFLHSILPHQPYALTTDGTVYPPVYLPGTQGSTHWPENEGVRLVGWQRLQMQLVATDRVLGDTIDVLRDAGVWDDAIVIVTSDHGITFEPGPQRQPGGAPLEVTGVPLFVKTPENTRTGVSELSALTIDIAPTLVALQGGQPDAIAFDGVDLFGSHVPKIRTEAYLSGGQRFTPLQDLEELRNIVTLRAAWISPDGGPQQVFRPGSSGGLVGKPTPASLASVDGATASVPSDFGRRTPERSHLVGVITVDGYDGDEILVAVNDVIAGVGIRIGESAFHVALDPGLVPDPVTSVQVVTPNEMLIDTRVEESDQGD